MDRNFLLAVPPPEIRCFFMDNITLIGYNLKEGGGYSSPNSVY
jgi:hypothetical protein